METSPRTVGPLYRFRYPVIAEFLQYRPLEYVCAKINSVGSKRSWNVYSLRRDAREFFANVSSNFIVGLDFRLASRNNLLTQLVTSFFLFSEISDFCKHVSEICVWVLLDDSLISVELLPVNGMCLALF